MGNDVWIGNGAFISSGISIGDGAVIGGRSVVTRDIKPYEIVVGVPAKHLRYRFDEATRAALLAIRWWAWPDHIVEAALPAIMSSDIGALADKAAELGMTTG
ncbi:acetyltransferase [Sphingomonas sp. Leaf38]|nr:acetyltransferase [Sphingomonas sp. Leaf38]